jgi:hypothetical protein
MLNSSSSPVSGLTFLILPRTNNFQSYPPALMVGNDANSDPIHPRQEDHPVDPDTPTGHPYRSAAQTRRMANPGAHPNSPRPQDSSSRLAGPARTASASLLLVSSSSRNPPSQSSDEDEDFQPVGVQTGSTSGAGPSRVSIRHSLL